MSTDLKSLCFQHTCQQQDNKGYRWFSYLVFRKYQNADNRHILATYLYCMNYCKLTCLLVLGFVLGSCTQQQTAEPGSTLISGKVAGVEGKVYLLMERDHDLVKGRFIWYLQGKFTLNAEMPSPEVVFIQLNSSDNLYRLFAEEGNIEIEVDPMQDDLQIVYGSAADQSMREAMEVLKPYDEELNHLFELFRTPRSP